MTYAHGEPPPPRAPTADSHNGAISGDSTTVDLDLNSLWRAYSMCCCYYIHVQNVEYWYNVSYYYTAVPDSAILFV